MRDALNFLCEYARSQKYDLRFALEAKPNEPRSDLYLPTTGAMLGFIATLDHAEMVGVNPEVAHEHMAGLHFTHAIAQAWDAGKLLHIDLNDQVFRFGAAMLRQAFFVVKFLEDVGYDGSRHFDAHAYRTEDYDGVRDFARGCMRTYLILKEKAARFRQDAEIQALLAEINTPAPELDYLAPAFDKTTSRSERRAIMRQLKRATFDRDALGARGLAYERLDQLTTELLLGVR